MSTSNAQASVAFLSAADDLLTKLLLDYSIFNEPRLGGRATGKMIRFARELRMSDNEVEAARTLVDKVSAGSRGDGLDGAGDCGSLSGARCRRKGGRASGFGGVGPRREARPRRGTRVGGGPTRLPLPVLTLLTAGCLLAVHRELT